MFHLHQKMFQRKKSHPDLTGTFLALERSEDYEAWRGCLEEVSGGTERGFDWSWDEGGGEAKDSSLCSCFSLIGLGQAQREWRAGAELRQQAWG